jgi:hypothetical protein
MKKQVSILTDDGFRDAEVSVQAVDNMVNEYGTGYGVVFEVSAPSWIPNHLAYQYARELVGDNSDVWNQSRLQRK